MINHKILFIGPVGAGKSTAITTLSNIPPIATNKAVRDITQDCKAATTAAMEYGVTKLASGEHLHMFGTNGLGRSNFLWDILIERCVGLVLLINNNAVDPFGDLHYFLDAYDRLIVETGVVIGITCMDEKHQPTILDYHLQLEETKYPIPIFEVDARVRRDLAVLVKALFKTRGSLLSTRESEQEA